jgi:hypothetical protein
VKDRNPSLATKAGLGAGSTLVRTVWAHPRGRDLAHRFCWAAMDSDQTSDHK